MPLTPLIKAVFHLSWLLTILCFLSSSVLAQTCVQPPAGLVSWWPGDGNTTDIADQNDGTPQSGVTFADGVVGQGFRLDGIDDFIEIPDAPNLKPQRITVDAWIMFERLETPGATVPGVEYIVFKKNTLTINFEGYALLKTRVEEVDRFEFTASSAEGVQFMTLSTTVVETGQFYHVAGTYDGGAVRLYVNGVLEDEQPATLELNYDTRPIFIGTSGEDFFDGKLAGVIDEVEIFNRALSASEIQAIFNAGSAGKCKETEVQEVQIDIQPGSAPNPINPKSNGTIQVAILTTNPFDATTVDPLTVRFGPEGPSRSNGAKKYAIPSSFLDTTFICA